LVPALPSPALVFVAPPVPIVIVSVAPKLLASNHDSKYCPPPPPPAPVVPSAFAPLAPAPHPCTKTFFAPAGFVQVPLEVHTEVEATLATPLIVPETIKFPLTVKFVEVAFVVEAIVKFAESKI
jgi:hypothetical protein